MTVRSRSLFWTFAGVFLLVVVGAALLQFVVSVAVLRPLAAQGARQRAQITLDLVARRLAELPPSAGGPAFMNVLRANAPRERGQMLAFSASIGPVLHDRMVAPEVHRGIVMVLAAAGLVDSLADERERPVLPGPGPWAEGPGPQGPPGRVAGPPEGWRPPGPPQGPRAEWRPEYPPDDGLRPPGPRPDEWRPMGPPPDGRGEWRRPGPRDSAWRAQGPPPGQWRPMGPPPGGREGEWRPPGAAPGERRMAVAPPPERELPRDRDTVASATAPSGGPPGRFRGPALRGPAERFELLAHQAVVRDGQVMGELAVVGPASGAPLWALPESRGLVLVLPLALLISTAAGLFMVRMLVRRLNALERVTDRLSAGDALAPENAPELDEIGRLEWRFNRMADRVVASRERLGETDRQRRRLLADISHELATPLTSIRGYVETLLDPRVTTTTDERKRYLQDVLEESTRLDAMIAQLFDLARLEAGATPLKRDRLDWTELCRNTVRRLEPRFREARISIAWVGPAEPAWVMADGRRLEEVAENLLSNVLRYVPAGGAVQVAMAPVTTASGERVRFTVEDDGPGIAEADLPHVFERFYRAEAVRSMGGTGLGLAIVSEIVRLHGGQVSARRREPRGAAFVVDLPRDGDGSSGPEAGPRP